MKSYYQISQPILHGSFYGELKNRFLAAVRVNNERIECYIPSSARLENFISLENRRVLLVPTQSPKARTAYSVLAVKIARHNVLLNTSLANRAMFHYLHFNKNTLFGTHSSIQAEKSVDGYKADIFVESQGRKCIIEIKSVLSLDHAGVFPTVFSERANKQLSQLCDLLDRYAVEYSFVAINPKMDSIRINSEQKEYHTLFSRCVEKGMIFKAYSCVLKGKE